MDEEGASLLGNQSNSADSFVPGKKDRLNPCTGGFWRYHFGSDALLASWCFLIGSALWVWMESDNVVTGEQLHSFAVSFDYGLTLSSAVIFTIGSAYFVYLTYPEKMQEQMAQMQEMAEKAERGELSLMQRYFTGTDMLIATWSFNIAFLPFIVYGFYLIGVDPTSAAGYVEVLAIGLVMGLTGIWVFSAMPENMMKNEGMGSTVCHDRCLSKWWCCGGRCASKELWQSDMLVGLWIFTILTLFAIPYAIYLLIEEPTLVYSWVDAVMMALFVFGMGLMTYSAYPQNFGKSTAFDTLTCSKAPKLDPGQ